MKEVTRKQVSILSSDYKEVFLKESHHNHKIIEMDNGVLRWKENKHLRGSLKTVSLNDLIPILFSLGYDKNSEVYRKLYRDLGYSISGYWEIFYWEMNNDEASEYRNTFIERVENFIKYHLGTKHQEDEKPNNRKGNDY